MLSIPRALFLIAGPSGVGKTTLVEWVVSRVGGLVPLQKAVTRSLRDSELFGREVVPLEAKQFQQRVKDGRVVATYEKYGERYGLFKKSERLLQFSGAEVWVSGMDVLKRTPAITVGDAYEAPRAIRSVAPDLVVVLLHARIEILLPRLLGKLMSRAQMESRLETVKQEYAKGYPRDVEKYDHIISMEEDLETAGKHLRQIIDKEQQRATSQARKALSEVAFCHDKMLMEELPPDANPSWDFGWDERNVPYMMLRFTGRSGPVAGKFTHEELCSADIVQERIRRLISIE